MSRTTFFRILNCQASYMWIHWRTATGPLKIHMWKWRFLSIPFQKKSKIGLSYLEETSLVQFFTRTIDNTHYWEIIDQFVALFKPEERYCWFQQDNDTIHPSNATWTFLTPFFDEYLIFRILWSRRLPDLSPLDYFPWGFIKDKAYANKPTTIEALKTNVTNLICDIQPKTLKNVFWNLEPKQFPVPRMKVDNSNSFCNLLSYDYSNIFFSEFLNHVL